MSQTYIMRVEVQEFAVGRGYAIIDACSKEWPFCRDKWTCFGGSGRRLTCEADGSLCRGELEAEFVDRLSIAIWLANQAYCYVEVMATPLCDDTHVRDSEDYQRLISSTS